MSLNNITNIILSIKTARWVGACLLLGLIMGSYYFDHILRITPCILCWMQRGMLAISAFFWIRESFATNKTNVIVFNLCSVLAGLSLAIKQSYLQSIQSAEQCFPSLSFLASTDCASVTWMWHGLSLANLAILLFASLACFLGLKLALKAK